MDAGWIVSLVLLALIVGMIIALKLRGKDTYLVNNYAPRADAQAWAGTKEVGQGTQGTSPVLILAKWFVIGLAAIVAISAVGTVAVKTVDTVKEIAQPAPVEVPVTIPTPQIVPTAIPQPEVPRIIDTSSTPSSDGPLWVLIGVLSAIAIGEMVILYRLGKRDKITSGGLDSDSVVTEVREWVQDKYHNPAEVEARQLNHDR